MALKTAKEVFALLRAFMENEGVPSPEKRDLWLVLTALRGPDNEDEKTKFATTSVIRYAVFGGVVESYGAIAHRDTADLAETRRDIGGDGDYSMDHFTQHTWRAFKALGLKWDEVNDKEG